MKNLLTGGKDLSCAGLASNEGVVVDRGRPHRHDHRRHQDHPRHRSPLLHGATDAKWSKPPDLRRAENGRTTIQAPRHYTANLRIDGAPDSSTKISFNLDGIDDAVASARNGRAQHQEPEGAVGPCAGRVAENGTSSHGVRGSPGATAAPCPDVPAVGPAVLPGTLGRRVRAVDGRCPACVQDHDPGATGVRIPYNTWDIFEER
ncbi:hypothetical protein GCM10018963_07230 [Saccharothrix longispora]